MFMETLDRLLVGEAVSERSGDETEAVVAVDEVEFIFLTCKKKTVKLTHSLDECSVFTIFFLNYAEACYRNRTASGRNSR